RHSSVCHHHRVISCFSPHPTTTHIYTLSLHDALPIFPGIDPFRAVADRKIPAEFQSRNAFQNRNAIVLGGAGINGRFIDHDIARSEEHTSELQSRENLVCRLLLEKKKKKSNEDVDGRC